MRKKNELYCVNGFTLLELMVTLFISSIIMVAAYSSFHSQQQSFISQDQVTEIQENIRAGLDMMMREIRMAGYDPSDSVNAGIVIATAGQLSFTQDLNGDGDLSDSNESVTYGFSAADDADGNGIVDDINGDGVVNDIASLGRNTGGGFQAIADNFQAIEFNYILSDGSSTTSPTTSQLNLIRSIQVSLLVRSTIIDNNYTDTKTYVTASGGSWGPFNDHYRRRFLTFIINARNLGI